jgi:L-lactate dehydrogenase (cytochrome)
MAKLTGDDVAKHNSKDSCWVIVHGKAYDVTEFLPGRREKFGPLDE